MSIIELIEQLKAMPEKMEGFNSEGELVVLNTHNLAESLKKSLRNCDRPECATTKAAQEVWRKEDGGKTAYYEWLLATYTEGGTTDGKKH